MQAEIRVYFLLVIAALIFVAIQIGILISQGNIRKDLGRLESMVEASHEILFRIDQDIQFEPIE